MSDWEPFRPCACDACGAPSPRGLCRRCRLAYYCDVACQRAVYAPRHRAACHAAARAATLETVLRLCARGGREGSVLGFLRQEEALGLRAASRACRDAVAEHAWAEFDDGGGSRILGSVAAWRSCFPYARTANISGNRRVCDADFALLRGLERLRMRGCSQAGITDAAFEHLGGIQWLDMSGCCQAGITDAAFAHLGSVVSLDMGGCTQATITDAAFAHLHEAALLTLDHCNQRTITDAAFSHLREVRWLSIRGCNQRTITDAAFAPLRKLLVLNMDGCSQLTDASIVRLRGFALLSTYGCPLVSAAVREESRRRIRNVVKNWIR